MSAFDFVGAAYEAPSLTQDAQECINWRPEVDMTKPEGSRGVVALYPTPGFTLAAQLINGAVRGMHTVSGETMMIACVGVIVYSLDANMNITQIGTLLTNSGRIWIDDNGLQIYFTDGANRYACTIANPAGTFAPVTDGAFTGGSSLGVADNYFVYPEPNSQQWSASNQLATTTNALSFSSKDGAPDNIVALTVNNRYIYLLGEFSSEVWIDVGTFPFPFQRIPGSNTQHGCAAANSVYNLGESFAFLAKDDRGQGIVVQTQGYAFKRISTHAVENSLLGKVISDAIAYTYQIEGHECYVLILPTADLTWVYDLATGLWHKWMSLDIDQQFHRHRSNCATTFNGKVVVGDYENGRLYYLDNNVYTEANMPIRRLRRCQHLTSDLQRQFFEELQIQFQPGVGLQTGQGSDPQAMVRWSDDGGFTYGNEHWKTLGKQGKYKNRAMWRRMGWGRDRIYEVSMTDPVKAVIVSANLKATAGVN